MKISKLFHSLYALLMLAPVFAVGGAMAFNIINDKAVDNAQSVDISYTQALPLYQTNEVNSSSDLVIGNFYKFDFDISSLSISSGYASYFFRTSYLTYVVGDNFIVNSCSNDSYFYLVKGDVGSRTIVKFFFNDTFYISLPYNNGVVTYYGLLTELPRHTNLTTVSICPQQYIPYTLEEVNITYPDNLSDNFYFAMDSMNNSQVFSWAKTSFFAEPFSYIFGLFGIPSGSPFITLLSYWLSISIIWLVFDLVMYVPLLVHGWLDKGAIE